MTNPTSISRTLEELDADISLVPLAWRRYCTASWCGCMGCVQAGLSTAGKPSISEAQFKEWAAAFPEKCPLKLRPLPAVGTMTEVVLSRKKAG